MSNKLPPPKILPGGQHIQHAGLHWIAEIDPDGRQERPELYEWQPGIQQWCRPGDIAKGRDVELNNHEYVSPATSPLPKYFQEQLADIIKRVDLEYKPLDSDTITMSNEDWNVIRRLMLSVH